MMVRRDISSIPFRSASETWQSIIDLVTARRARKTLSSSKEPRELWAPIITDEHPASRAIMLEGVGARLRVYCRYGLKALEEGGKVDSLTWNPTAGDWTMHVPCDEENIVWVRKSLAGSPRIKIFDVAETDRAEDEEKTSAAKAESSIVVDWNLKG